MTTRILFRGAEVAGRRTNVIVDGAFVVATGPDVTPERHDEVIDANGGALLPGLADHHLHLAATAAAATSADLNVAPSSSAAATLRSAPPDSAGWVRGVGYEERRLGDLDRYSLDLIRNDLPVRVQHRSGALWVLNSRALDAVDAARAHHPGIERDVDGIPTGRIWRADDWLGAAIPSGPKPHLESLGTDLAAFGVTRVTDASPTSRAAELAAAAVHRGDLPQIVQLMAADAQFSDHPRLRLGPAKVVVTDHDLPDLNDLVHRFRTLHSAGRPVAVHCVTRVGLALTLAALDISGHVRGDRIEHCSVADDDSARILANKAIAVVTQPALLRDRGDDYWTESEPNDRSDLWPYGGLLSAGVRVAPSSDAPYGDLDPWSAMAAAHSRTTRSGRVVGADQVVSVARALTGYLSDLQSPGGVARSIRPGSSADLVLLHVGLAEVLAAPTKEHVRATFINGRLICGG